MNRDPKNSEGTREPIFLLQVGYRKWTEVPGGVGMDSESIWIEDESLAPAWMRQHADIDGNIDETEQFWETAESEVNRSEWPFVYIEWRTESVFLTLAEAEQFASATEYRYQKWKVHCILCDGELAKLLREAGFCTCVQT